MKNINTEHMSDEAEMIWDELSIGERLEIYRRIVPGKSAARNFRRALRYVEKNLSKYQDLLHTI